MASFSNLRSGTPIIPTQQIYATSQVFEKENITLEMFVFAHVDSDIVELFVQSVEADIEYEHVFLSKKAILEQVDDEIVARFELARHNRTEQESENQSENELLDECTNEMIGEFIVDHVSLDPKDNSKLLIAPVKDSNQAPMHLTALKPHGKSDLNFNRGSIESPPRKSSGASFSSQDGLKPVSSSAKVPHTSSRRPSLVLKAVEAFKQSVAHKESSEQFRANMHPAKGRLHKSVKRVMLQNAVAKVRQMLKRPPSKEPVPENSRSRPGSANSTGAISPTRRPSSLETAREAIASRNKEKSP